jgi:hypothetical protein
LHGWAHPLLKLPPELGCVKPLCCGRLCIFRIFSVLECCILNLFLIFGHNLLAKFYLSLSLLASFLQLWEVVGRLFSTYKNGEVEKEGRRWNALFTSKIFWEILKFKNLKAEPLDLNHCLDLTIREFQILKNLKASQKKNYLYTILLYIIFTQLLTFMNPCMWVMSPTLPTNVLT